MFSKDFALVEYILFWNCFLFYDTIFMFGNTECFCYVCSSTTSNISSYPSRFHMLLVANLANTKWCNERNPGNWVLICGYSARTTQWIPTWQSLDCLRYETGPFLSSNLHDYHYYIPSASIISFCHYRLWFRDHNRSISWLDDMFLIISISKMINIQVWTCCCFESSKPTPTNQRYVNKIEWAST